MSEFENVITNTLSIGAIYALIGVGFVVMYRATRVVSFAQGGFMVVGAFLFRAMVELGLGLYLSTVVAAALLFVGGAVVFRITFARILGEEPFVVAIATIGLGTFIVAVSELIWGPNPIVVRGVIGTKPVSVLGLSLTPVSLYAIAMTAIIFAVLIVGLRRTSVGLKMRAVADVPSLAALKGVDVSGISMLAWAIAAGTAAIAGVAYILSTQAHPSGINSLGLLAFPAILLGGFDSIVGALVGALLVAFVQNLAIFYVGSQYQDVIAYAVLLLVLFVRPQGLFGQADLERL